MVDDAQYPAPPLKPQRHGDIPDASPGLIEHCGIRNAW